MESVMPLNHGEQRGDVRRSFDVPYDEPRVPPNRSRRKLALLQRLGLFGANMQGATIERACCLRDLRQAYGLVHDVFSEQGLILQHPAKLRLRVFEATVAMATFVAKVEGQIVGVISVVGDTEALGLPSDIAFKREIDVMRRSGARLCEVTNQVVAEGYRKSSVATELIRCAMAHVMCRGYDEGIAAVSPSHNAFYKLLNFREIGSERSYSDRIYDPVVALSLAANEYCVSPQARNECEQFLVDFMVDDNPYRARAKKWCLEAKLNFLKEDLLRSLFVEETSFLASCPPSYQQALRRHWGKNLFAAVTGSHSASNRREMSRGASGSGRNFRRRSSSRNAWPATGFSTHQAI